MTVSASSATLELRRDFAIGLLTTLMLSCEAPPGASRDLGGGCPLHDDAADQKRPGDRLRAPIPEQTGPARRQRLLHVRVCPPEVAPRLQHLRIHPVALEQTLCHPYLREPTNGELELAINLLLVACLLGDPAEPHVGFADAPSVSQLLRQVQRLLGKLARGRRVALLEAELAQAEQDVSAPRLVVGLIAELQRAVQVLARLPPIALRHQDQAELILGTGESDSF